MYTFYISNWLYIQLISNDYIIQSKSKTETQNLPTEGSNVFGCCAESDSYFASGSVIKHD